MMAKPRYTAIRLTANYPATFRKEAVTLPLEMSCRVS